MCSLWSAHISPSQVVVTLYIAIGFCVFILYLTTFLNLLLNLRIHFQILVIFYVLPENRYRFTSFSTCMALFFSCLFALLYLPVICWIRVLKTDILFWFPILWRKIKCRCHLSGWEDIPSISTFLSILLWLAIELCQTLVHQLIWLWDFSPLSC